MFTIKHVTPLGNEALYAATEVTFSQANETYPSGYKAGTSPLTGSIFW